MIESSTKILLYGLLMASAVGLPAFSTRHALAQRYPSTHAPMGQFIGETDYLDEHPQIALLPPVEASDERPSIPPHTDVVTAQPSIDAGAEAVHSVQLEPTHVHLMPPPTPEMYYAPATDFGPSLRLFEPKARVYFDTGWEAPDKLDIFHDGALAPSINFLEIFWAKPWDERLGREDWRWGPNVGIGISSRAGDSSDGTVEASGAPVLLLSYGFLLEFPLVSEVGRADGLVQRGGPKAGIEFGYALGVSSDESLDYSADGALYVGVSLHAGP